MPALDLEVVGVEPGTVVPGRRRHHTVLVARESVLEDLAHPGTIPVLDLADDGVHLTTPDRPLDFAAQFLIVHAYPYRKKRMVTGARRHCARPPSRTENSYLPRSAPSSGKRAAAKPRREQTSAFYRIERKESIPLHEWSTSGSLPGTTVFPWPKPRSNVTWRSHRISPGRGRDSSRVVSPFLVETARCHDAVSTVVRFGAVIRPSIWVIEI
jgi:hypothetical protein